VHALALRAEQRQHLSRLGASAAEPVRDAGVELCDLAGRHDEVVLGQPQPQSPGQDVHPLVTLVGLLLDVGLVGRSGRNDHLVRPWPGRPLRQRNERPAIALERPQPDAWVARRGSADEVVERHLVRASQGEQQLQGRPAATGLQARQRTRGDAGHRGQPGERQLVLLAQGSQARADHVQYRVVVHLSIANPATKFVKSCTNGRW
jgi:hypothetical protein